LLAGLGLAAGLGGLGGLGRGRHGGVSRGME
jgi:hypothetical protein